MSSSKTQSDAKGQNRLGSFEDSQWRKKSVALDRARVFHGTWTERRKSKHIEGQSWERESFSLPRPQAQAKAREFLTKYPKAAYWSEVEAWRELPDDVIEFTMRRLPSAD